MKLLLTSSGLMNASIKSALLGMVGKPASELHIVFITTASNAEGGDKSWMVKDLVNIKSLSPKVLDMLDIAALPKEMWLPRVESADVIVVGGGNAFYLSYCFQQSGFFDELPRLLNDKAYVGISAGSMIVGDNLSFTSDALASHHDTEYDEFGPEGFSSAKTTKFVDFVIRPHYLSAKRTGITKELLQAKVKEIKTPLYAIDDMSAVRVIDGKTDVISEGEWEYIES